MSAAGPAIRLEGVGKRFAPQAAWAVQPISADIAPGRITGLVGPDGAGKTTLLRLIAGLLAPSCGRISVAGIDPAREPALVHATLAYMPQRFGLYEDLSVAENLRLFADLRGLAPEERAARFARLLDFTDLRRFTGRLAGHLSGGMKQKLGLACTLLGQPRVLLLDEPGVGVDPIARRELWRMVGELVGGEDGTAVIWSTAYLDEAEACARVLLLSEGTLLYDGPPADFTARTAGRAFRLAQPPGDRRRTLSQALRRPDVTDGTVQGVGLRLLMAPGCPPPAELGPSEPTPSRFEDAFIDRLGGAPKVESALAASFAPRAATRADAVVEARGLTRRFGSFVAADNVSFRIGRGEVFGLLGPNGAGKSTIFKMMCGLLRPSAGQALVDGVDLTSAPSAGRARIGYMAQKFSLYGNLTVRQNLEFFASVYGLSSRHGREAAIARVCEALGLGPVLREPSGQLPLGYKQRLALACAVMHGPAVLFLDEPTSGVDPIARREFWIHVNGLAARGVTIMVTTHFLDEAEYCDRVALIYRGRAIAEGDTDALKSRVRGPDLPDPSLQDAFISLIEADDETARADAARAGAARAGAA